MSTYSYKAHCALIDFVHQILPVHSHDLYELIYCQNGSGTILINGEEYPLLPDSIFLIPPHTEHSENISGSPFFLFSIMFQSDKLLPLTIVKNHNFAIGNIIHNFQSECSAPFFSEELLNAYLVELAVNIERIHYSRSPQKDNFINFVISYICKNSHKRLRPKDFAKITNYSYDYFQHRFKETTGLSPQQFLIRERIKRAKSLLLENTMNCTEIAYQCGFASSTQFASIFKREVGITPKQYQTKHTKNTP